MNARTWLPLALLFTLACEPVTTVTRLSSNAYPSKPEGCEIQILTEAPRTRKFEEIAILSTVTIEGSAQKDLNAMLPGIKQAACGLGADAVLIKNVDPGSSSSHSHGKAYTVAIKYLD